MSALLPTVLLGLLAVVVYHLSLYRRQLRIARDIGLPYFSFPISDSKKWYLIAFLIAPLFHLLPPRLAAYVNFSTYLRRWHSKYTVHREVGDVLLMVSTGDTHVYVADADAAREVLNGRGRFLKPSWNYSHLKLFGDNVVACDDAEWVHHRKQVGPPFSEGNSQLVWEQALFQVTSMLRSWGMPPASAGHAAPACAGPQVIANSRLDFRRLALHVISSAAFGVGLSFSTQCSDDSSEDRFFRDGEPPAGYSRSWRGALEYISANLSFVVVSLTLPAWAAPGARKSVADVEGYINTLIRRGRQKGRTAGDGECGNLLSAMIHSEDTSDPLTDREIMGNAFTFSIAGHETVAAALQFALLLLALHPQAQEWFHRRLDEQLSGLSADPQDWDYKVYDRLSSGRCLFYETLRLFPPIAGHAKYVNTTQTLTVNGRVHHLPAYTWVTVDATALHLHPTYWGPSADTFLPSRWDLANPDSFLARFPQPDNGWNEAPGLYRPRAGSYNPFSGGQRMCLGRKFATVEFVAVMAVLMRRKKVAVARIKGETREMANKRAWDRMNRSMSLISLAMRHDVGVVFEDR